MSSPAPHLDETWEQDLVIELRLRGVTGDRIGSVLREVESHCLDSGEGAHDAFGDPVEYARTLQLPVPDRDEYLGSTAPILVQGVGMFAVAWSFEAWLRGTPLEVTTGHAVGTAITALAIGLAIRFGTALLRGIVQPPKSRKHSTLRWIAVSAGYGMVIGTGAMALVLLDTTIWQLPTAAGLAAGTIVLVGGVGWALVRIRAGRGLSDPITPPLDAPAATSSLLGTLIETAMMPLGTAFLMGLSLVLHSIAGR